MVSTKYETHHSNQNGKRLQEPSADWLSGQTVVGAVWPYAQYALCYAEVGVSTTIKRAKICLAAILKDSAEEPSKTKVTQTLLTLHAVQIKRKCQP